MRKVGALLALCVVLLLGPGCARDEGGVRLYVLVSVDQLRRDVPLRYLPYLTGGIRRVYEDGLVHTEARLAHGVTETAPGHSVLLSGLDPSETGIVANTWYRLRSDGRTYEAVHAGLTEGSRLLDPRTGERTDRPGAGPGQLLPGVTTLADSVLADGGRVLAIAGKDRAAICMVGRISGAQAGRHAVLWYDRQSPGFTASDAYSCGVPAWARDFNASLPGRIEAYWDEGWRADEEAFYASVGAAADERTGESAYDILPLGKPNVFPYRTERPFEAVLQSPFLDTLTADLAIAGVEAMGLGTGAAPDLLAVSFSGHDHIGHAFGPRSRESASHVRSLDLDLGRLFAALDRAAGGADRWRLVFTADHGVVDLIPGESEGVRRRWRLDAERVSGMVDSLRAFAVAEFATKGEVVGRTAEGDPAFGAGGLYLDPDFHVWLDADEARWSRLAEVLPELPRWEFLGRAVPAHRLSGDDPVEAALLRSYHPDRSPPLFLVTRPGDYVSTYAAGTGHGTPHPYDREVPLVLLQGEIHRGQTSDEPIDPTAVPALLRGESR